MNPTNTRMRFDPELLIAIGNWQKGWREDQDRRLQLAAELESHTNDLSAEFRSVDSICYRKRFLHRGELQDIVLEDQKDEGLTSWTTDIRFAERFKGYVKDDAISAAIFEHAPTFDEVVVNIPKLWEDSAFRSEAEKLRKSGHESALPLFHFHENTQSEVILRTPLKGSQIIAFSGIASPFDDLCDTAGIPECQRDIIFRQMIDSGQDPGAPVYTSREGARNVVDNTIKQILNKLYEHMKMNEYPDVATANLPKPTNAE